MKWPARILPIHRAVGGGVGTALLGQAALLVSGITVARLLGVENRGHLALLMIMPLLIAVLGSLGVSLATTFEIARNPSLARALLQRVWRWVVLQTALLMLLHALTVLLVYRAKDADVQLAAALTLPLVPAIVAQQLGLAVLQGQQRFGAFNAFRLAPALLYSALIAGLAIASAGTLPVIAACSTGSLLLTGLVVLGAAIRGTQPAPPGAEAPSFRELIRFGSRSVLGSTSPSDGFGLDQAVIGLFLSSTALGLYVVAVAFTQLSRLVAQSLGMVAYPNVAARHDPADSRRAMWRFFALGCSTCLLILVILEASIGWLLPQLFGSEFQGAVGVAQILLIGGFFAGARRILNDASRGAHLPVPGTVAEITAWVVLPPVLALLAPRFGIDGVAAAVTITSLVSLATLVWLVARTDVGRANSHVEPGRKAADTIACRRR